VSVFLAYLGPRGRTLIDGEVYLPCCRAEDPLRCARRQGPRSRPSFATKIALARRVADADPRGDVSDFGASIPQQGASTPIARVAPGPPAVITITAPRTARAGMRVVLPGR
jgi:hypothetical protein